MKPATLTSSAALRQRLITADGASHLAACSIAPRTIEVEQALCRMFDDLARPGFWRACEEQADQARRLFAQLIGAHPDQIAILPNASVAAYQVASSRRWRRRRELLASTAEFPGIAHTWLNRLQARVRWVGSCDGVAQTDDYLPQITPRIGMVSVPAVTYRDAVHLNVARIADAAHSVGATVFVDAYQAAGVMPLTVDGLRCDYLVAGTGKYLLGLPGLAFLYVRDPDGPPPTLTGWLGRVRPFDFRATVVDFPTHARRYETGTPAAAAMYAAVAGLTLVNGLDLWQVRRHTQQLITAATRRLSAHGEVLRTAAHPDAQGAHVALFDPDADAIAAWLGDRGILAAPRGRVLRLATHAYTTDDDIDAACASVVSYRRHHRNQSGGR
ncbi:aminotransferase class V-fold PLP-dependent enzyme [Micromonospora sp. WMMD980]|uniref:aminotransferase class V-fold PLP-dependent enzyme n=1 Tax=Micromonospora sp. WMMD980 TaxID=3016088 RepID=UPI002415D7B5|nr:aminotransferase class V-fold PLP-dependent enzyme [Micromonospora sp. WMMD980]MDG4803605.1 aminotransferase class V-fold PLP-dependent enzyme [Micromonospora sp. WMMD980]